MLCANPSQLRSAVLSSRLQPAYLSCAYSTSSPSSPRTVSNKPSHPAGLTRPAVKTSRSPSPPSATFVRNVSSSSVSSSADGAAPADHSSVLDWNTFLKLRKVRRRYNLAASIGTSLGTTVTGISFLSQQDVDALGGQVLGLDPFVVLGLATAGFGAVGWLAGPFVGNAAFNFVNKKYKGQFAAKEKAFYNRIKRYRVDPSSQSFSNPVPDYYGEKIGSVKDYRQWLKDQRAYNKKRQSFL